MVVLNVMVVFVGPVTILTTDTVHFYNHVTKKETDFKLLRPFSCLSTNVIYKISCKGCSLFYIGQTVHLRHSHST